MATLKSTILQVVLLVSGTLLCGFAAASAQSTVFNIPSTDVVPPHRGYVEADFMAHLSSYESGGYQLYGPRIVYGVGKRMEVGLNAFYVNTQPAEPVELQPNFKWKFYEDEGTAVGAATGVVLLIPVTHRASTATRGMIYAVASKNLKGSRGPRFTAGGYRLIGSFDPGTSKQGVLLGYEQPLNRKLTFVTDWTSGNNDLGYVVAGLGITLSPKHALYVGYNVGNQGRGNNSIGVFYGINF